MTIKLNDEVTCNNAEPLKGNTIAPPLKLGADYSIKAIWFCRCNKPHYDVGLPLDVNYVTCVDCREELPLTTHWCHPSRFTLKTT